MFLNSIRHQLCGAASVIAALVLTFSLPAVALDHASSEPAGVRSGSCSDPRNHPICIEVGQRAPVVRLRDFGNVVHRLTDFSYTGAERPRNPRKTVVLDFFSTNCQVCVRMLPALCRFAQTSAARGVQVLMVAVPEPDDHDLGKLKSFFARHPVPFPVLVDANAEEAYEWLSVTDGRIELPYLFLIDGQGFVRGMAGGEHQTIEEALPGLGNLVRR